MEPIISAELPIAVLLSVTLWHESLSLIGWLLVLTIFTGILLAVTEHHTNLHYHKRILEKGVVFAAMGALTNGFIDLLMGASGQKISPLLTVWGVWVIGTLITLAYLILKGKTRELVHDFKKHSSQLVGLSILDTGAWVGFTTAATIIPISITAAITEGYIIIAILMGLIVNHERLRKHQKMGVVLAATGILLLALTIR
jgi:drug/metabolite transporter (DMT)-like permease